MNNMATMYRSWRLAVPLYRNWRLGIHHSSTLAALSSLPVCSSCPESMSECAPTPSMPEGLPIDHNQPLNGTMAAYTKQVLISTGKSDWTSRIEEDGLNEGWGIFARKLKGLLGRGGKYADPYNNVIITNSSFVPSKPQSSKTVSVFLFPDFKYIRNISVDSESGTDPETFVRAFLLPHEKDLHPAHASLPALQRQKLARDPSLMSQFPDAIDIRQSPTILICGHGGRDRRCGTMGPVLLAEFRRVLRKRGFSTSVDDDGIGQVDGPNHANVGLISHIGGHKYAGNVIIYLPSNFASSSSANSLAGKGLWYGRIEPKHVEGLVEETFVRGRVIEDHFRGGIGIDGQIYRL